MDSLRSVRSQVALHERSLQATQATPLARVQTPPPAAPPRVTPPTTTQQQPQRPSSRPSQLVPVGQESARRPNLEELSIRAVEQMRRRGEVQNDHPSRRVPGAPTDPGPQSALGRLGSDAPRSADELRNALRIPGQARGAARQGEPRIDSRPTRELPPAEEAVPRPDPRRALQVVKRAVANGAYGADPTLARAMSELTDFVDRTAPRAEISDEPVAEQPEADEKPTFEEPPQEEPAPQQQDPQEQRGLLKQAPRFAFQRMMASVVATQGVVAKPPGAALDLHG